MKTLRSCIVGILAGVLVVGCGGGNLPTVPAGSSTGAPPKAQDPDPKGKTPTQAGAEADVGAVKPK